METKVELLRRVPFLRGAADRDLHRIAELVEVIDVPAGRELTTQGARTEAAFIIVEGTATSSVGRRFESIGRGGIVGQVALLDHGRHHATTTADGDATLIVIDRAHFDAFVTDGAVWPGLSRLLAARMRFTEAELANVEGRRRS